MKEVGIVGYGIAISWQKYPIDKTSYIAFRDIQDDSISFGIEATRNAVDAFNIDPSLIGVVVSGSMTKPYSVGQNAMHIGTYAGVGKHVFTADVEVGNSGGMQSINFACNHVEAGKVKYGLAVGTDSGSTPRIFGENTDGSGAVAVVLGEEGRIATIKDMRSSSFFDREFFKPEGSPRLEELNNDPRNYASKTIGAMEILLEKNDLMLRNFDYLAFSQPSYDSIRSLARELNSCRDERVRLKHGEIKEKILPWVDVLETGDLHNASPLMSMASILDEIQEGGKKILVTSYSPDSSIAMWLTTEDLVGERRARPTVQDYISRMINVKPTSYIESVKFGTVRMIEESIARPARIIGTIRGIEGAQTKKISLCPECKRVYSYETFSGKCLKSECESEKLKPIEIPVYAKLKSFRGLKPIERRKKTFDILNEGHIVIVECEESKLTEGMPVEMVYRMLHDEGPTDLLEYIPAFRPLFIDRPEIKKLEKSTS